MVFQVLYGVSHTHIDVTDHAWKCVKNETLSLPAGDYERSLILQDPVQGIVKEILVKFHDKAWVFPAGQEIKLSLPGILPPVLDPKKWKSLSYPTCHERLQCIHNNLRFEGNIYDEYPEQLLIAEFIKPEHVVLEIGSNIGRSTLVIASILENDKQLVTLECDPNSCAVLTHNRNINNMTFTIENAALSSFPMYRKGWNTFFEFNKPEDAVPITTISWKDFHKKHPLPFDTVVADCEGALLPILAESPELLDGIKLVIVENDYMDINHKLEVDRVFRSKGLSPHRNVPGGWGPCLPMFYQVWKAAGK